MPPGMHTTAKLPMLPPLDQGILVQDLHHSSLLLLVLHQHGPRPANVFDNVDDLAEARGSTTRLREARKAETGASAMLQDNEELDDEGDGFDLEIC